LDEARILGEALIQELQGHLPAELFILGQEHVGHAAGAQPRDDLVALVDQGARTEACHHLPSASRVWITVLAIGAATVAPNPPRVCATVTATATFGLLAGAKPMNQGWVR